MGRVRHDGPAAFAARAEAHLTGLLAVGARSCGPGNPYLINGLHDRNRSRVTVVAIAAPALLHVVSMRQELATPPKIGAEQAKGFGVWLAKAGAAAKSSNSPAPT